MKESELLESKELREELVAQVEILGKVKELFLIPNTELATTQQVADYYEVGLEAIKSLIKDNREEIAKDGLKNLTGTETKELLGRFSKNLANFRGYFTCENIRFNNRNNLLLPRRAILRIGMLLRDSSIAKEVRTQLLNIEEKTSIEVKTADITEEQSLAMSVGMSYASGDIEAFAMATTKMMDFKNRHIKKLEESNNALTDTNNMLTDANKALANGILKWEDRSRINFAVTKLAYFAHMPIAKMWNELYKQLKHKYHMDLRNRGKQPWIQHVEPKEWECVIKAFSALCEYYEANPEDMFHDLKVNT